MKKSIFLITWMLLGAAAQSALAQTADWQKVWDETLAAARKEGKVVVTGPPDTVVRQTLPAAFKARYGITLEYMGGRSSEVASKMRAERSANIYSVDAMISGLNTVATILYREKMLDPLKPQLILPEVVDPSKWIRGSLWFADPEQQYILRLSNTATSLMHVNTGIVKMQELRTARDLIDPKYRGKIALMDPTVPGSGTNTAAMLYAQLGEDYVKKLMIEQKPMITRDTRQLTDWLIRGTYPIVFGAEDEPVEKLRKEGMPLQAVYDLEGIRPASTAGFGMLAIINKAPHPNAAKIFVNWMASKEGQEVYSRALGTAPARNDIDVKKFLDPDVIPRTDVKYFDRYDWEFLTTTTENVRKWIKDVMKR